MMGPRRAGVRSQVTGGGEQKVEGIQSDTSNFASFRGTAVPGVITGGTPVPRFTSLCIEGRR